MAKIKTYIRIAKTSRGYRVHASTKPNHKPLDDGNYSRWKKFLPTIHFAVDMNIPDEAFEKASKVIAEINIPEEHLEINAETKNPEEVGR